MSDPLNNVGRMSNFICPTQRHFHVVFEQVGTFKRPSKTIVSNSPEQALAALLSTLPAGWRGGLSVFDDELGHEDEMPLLHTTV